LELFNKAQPTRQFFRSPRKPAPGAVLKFAKTTSRGTQTRAHSLSIDFPLLRFNNPRMARPTTVRRVKSYSAANGYVYQYCFYEGNRATYEGKPAGEFIYAVSADRKTTFPVRILVRQSALLAWAQTNGRLLTSTEEYAIAKIRLLVAFDEGSVPLAAEAAAQTVLLVDESNLESLLAQLNI
jgi:hypothetical protein